MNLRDMNRVNGVSNGEPHLFPLPSLPIFTLSKNFLLLFFSHLYFSYIVVIQTHFETKEREKK